MSQYFRAGEVVLWNPSNRVAELFVRGVGAVAPLVTVPPGIASGRPDEHEVDPDVFAAFVDALVEQYLSSSHPILRSLIEGVVATALVLVERAGRQVGWRGGFDPRDVSVGVGGVGAPGDAARLRELAGALARGMPR